MKRTSWILASRISLAALVASAGCAVAPADGGDGTGTSAEGLRLIYNLFSGQLLTPNGLCLDVKGDATTPGTALDAWYCNNTAAQNFTFVSSGEVTGPGGQCLDVNGSNGLVMNPCTGAGFQLWDLEGQRLVNRADSAGPRCASTPSVFPNPNDPVVLQGCAAATSGDTNDRWTTTGLTTTFVGIGENCVDITNGNTSPGATLAMYTCNATQAQNFHFNNAGQIVSAAGLCLEATNPNASAHTAGIEMNTCSGSAAQKWLMRGRSLVNTATFGCLDVFAGNPQLHAAIEVAQCNGTQAQQFFEPGQYTPGMATLLVVSDESMAPATSNLVKFKNNNKMPAALMTVNDLKSLVCGTTGRACAGMDSAAIVKAGIDFFYRNRGTKYVFLAGDSTLVPVRYETRYNDHYDDSTSGYYSPTDSYYANLYRHTDPELDATGSDIPTSFAPWDNGDGIYNLSAYWTPAYTWNPDKVDGYPDVAVGRLDVNAEADLQSYVTKVENYETNRMTGAGVATFIENAVYDNDNSTSPGDFIVQSNIASMFPASLAKSFVSEDYQYVVDTNYSGNRAAWPLPSPWVAQVPAGTMSFVQGSGVVLYFGHANFDGWNENDGVGFETLFDQSAQPSNFPMIFAGACLSGMFADQPGGPQDAGHFQATGNSSLPQTPKVSDFSASPPAPSAFHAFSNDVLAHAAIGGGIAYAGAIETHEPQNDLTDLYTEVAQRYTAGEKTLGDMWRQAEQSYWHTHMGSSATYQQSDSGEWEIREPRIYFGLIQFAGDPSLRMQRGTGVVR